MTGAAGSARRNRRAEQAVASWRTLGTGRAVPLAVECIQDETARCVFRLVGAAPGGLAVVAKRCERSFAVKERSIYLEVLPELPFPSLRLYGCVEQPGSDRAWLFLEEATGESYDPGREGHRRLAGHWLGVLHVLASDSQRASRLPRRDPPSFAPDLHAALAALDGARRSEGLAVEDRECLDRILADLRNLASRWHEITAFTAKIPRTLVHGDFKEPHIFFRKGPGGPTPLLLDWHECGFGAPALDVAKFLGYSVAPDLSAYLAVVERRWPDLTEETVRRLAFVGEACRSVASIRWEAERLCYGWPQGPMGNLRLFSGWLGDVLRAEPWIERATLGPRARVAAPRSWY